MNAYTLHINLYDLAFLGAIFIGFTFALLLWFTQTINRSANRFLALALATMILWMIRILAIDTRLETYLPHWDWLPMQFLLALGPLMYFYVLKITRPQYKFSWRDLLHLSPLLLELTASAFEISESAKTGVATYATNTFQQLNPLLQLLIFISNIIYLYQCNKLIQHFYRQLQPVLMDRPLVEFRWLRRLLAATALLWLLWMVCAVINYFGYRNQLGIQVYYSFYIFFVVIIIWTAMAAFLKPQAAVVATRTASIVKQAVPAELKAKGVWLKRAMEANLYYQDPDLSLGTMAEKLGMLPHELSRVINTVFKKNFNDFINEYRVIDAARKMNDPAYDHITLLGIGFEAGFNSKTSFNRIFKQMTGKSPTEYKKHLEIERPTYNLGRHPRPELLILNRELPQRWIPSTLNSKYMFRNYVKIALRQLLKQKMYGAIKIGGFAFSIAACILIGLYIISETGYDRYYPDADRIFRIVSTVPVEGKPAQNNYMPAPVARTYRENFPEVENVGRIMYDPEFPGSGANEVRAGGQEQNTHEEGFAYADQNILDILKLPMVYGDRANALATPRTVVITKSKADKYFPGQNPVGKILYLNNDVANPYRVGGVIQNFPASSHIQYPFLLSLKNMELFPGEQNNWEANNYDVYVLLRKGTNVADFEKKSSALVFSKYIVPVMKQEGNKDAEQLVKGARLRLQPVTDIHLHSAGINDSYAHGDIRFIWLFAGIAAFILLIACINFINLSTAKSANRAKEVGLRKVVGSTRFALIGQFLTESILMSLLSFVAGIILAWALLPYFNTLSSKSLAIPWLAWWFIPTILTGATITGLLAGLYPAFYLSAFKPASVLKGALSTGSKNSSLRSVLVIFQFSTSIILIISTMVIYSQVEFILHKKLGFDKNQVVMLEGTNTLGNNVQTFKKELLKLSAVKSVTISDYLPVAGTTRSGTLFYNEGKEKQESGVGGQIWQIDQDYLQTMGIKLVAGRNFSPTMTTDSQAVVINEALAKKLNLINPIGKHITVGGRLANIIGVVADFNFESMRDQIYGLCMQLGNSPSIIAVKVNGGDMQHALVDISTVWKQFSPTQSIRYSFLDERFAAMYADMQTMGNIFTSFAVLAIIISCLGLFALSAFMAEQRKKEIGIRKVLGASVRGITAMLSVNFVKLVLISIVVASPVAWLLMDKWLEDFAYRTSISWWLFAVAAVMAIAIALLTVCYQSIKAALTNPVKSLKSE